MPSFIPALPTDDELLLFARLRSGPEEFGGVFGQFLEAIENRIR